MNTQAKFDPTRGDQTPLTGYLAALPALAAPIWLWSYDETTYMARLAAWLAGFIAATATLDYWLQRDTLQTVVSAQKLRGNRLLSAAAFRWFAWLLLLLLGLGLYQGLQHYRDPWYAHFHAAYRKLLALWLVFGFFYFYASLPWRHGRRWDRKDPAIYLLVALRRSWRNLRAGQLPWCGLSQQWRAPSARLAWLGLAVKAFFVPVMLSFFFYNGRNLTLAAQDFWSVLGHEAAWTEAFYDTAYKLYRVCYEGMFMADVTLAISGYLLTSRWLNNGMASVEQTGLGWAVCLACYRPFNDLAGSYIPWPASGIEHMADTPLKLMAMLAILLLLSVYAWATLAFGLRFSNLTYRGVVARGPYRWLRHPAYAAKCAAWWLEYAVSFTNAAAILMMLAWNGIYWLRAYSEERHLSRFAAYREYKRQVRWRFIPGLI